MNAQDCTTSVTGEWTGSGTTYMSNLGSTTVTFSSEDVDGAVSTVFTPNGAFYANPADDWWTLENPAEAVSLEFAISWDSTTDLDQEAAIDAVTREVVITFDSPVTNPIIHIDRLGGNYTSGSNTQPYISNSSIWTLVSDNVVIQRLSGNDQFVVDGNVFYREPNVDLGSIGERPGIEAVGNNGLNGTAAGSLLFEGTFTELVFSVTGQGPDGQSANDGVEFILQAPTDDFVFDIPDVEGCVGQVVNLVDFSDDLNFLFADGTPVTIAPNLLSVTVQDETQTYEYTAINGGCSYSSSFTVSVASLEYQLADVVTVCVGQSAVLGSVSDGITVEGNNVSINDNNEIVIIGDKGIYDYTLTDVNGCSATYTVEVFSGNEVPFDVNQDVSVCGGTTATLISVIPSGYSVTASPEGTYIEGESLLADVSVTTEFEITIQTTEGCETSTTSVVTVFDGPMIDVPSEISSCGGTEVTLTQIPLGVNVDVVSGPAVIVGGQVIVTDEASNNDVVELTAVNAEGCVMSFQTTVLVGESPEVVVPDETSVCMNQIGTVAAQGQDSYSYEWVSMGDVSIVGATNMNTVQYEVENGGQLILTTTNSEGCITVNTVNVTGLELPSDDLADELYACDGQIINIPVNGNYNYVFTSTGSGTLSYTGSGTSDLMVYYTPTGSGTGTGSGSAMYTDRLDVVISNEFCKVTSYIDVNVTNNPLLDIEQTVNICSGESVVLNPNGNPNYNYVWSATPAYNFVDANAVSPEVFVSEDTEFTVIATSGNVNACQFEATVDVVVNDPVDYELTSADSIDICPGGSFDLGIETQETAEVWNYYNEYVFENGMIVDTIRTFGGSGISDLVYDYNFMVSTGSGSGFVESVIISEFGCETSVIIPVNVNDAVVLINNGQSTLDFCLGDEVELVASSGDEIASVVWLDSDGNMKSTDNPYTFVPSGSDNCTVVATMVNGCTAEATIGLIENSVDVTVTSSTGTDYCLGETVTLEATSDLPVTWICTDGTQSNEDVITFNPEGDVTCTATVVDGSCQAEASITLIQGNGADVTIEATDLTICEGDATILTAVSDANTTYVWSTGSTEGTISVNPTETTTYTVTATDAAGCTGVASTVINVVDAPSVIASASPSSIEEGDSSVLTVDNADDNCTYVWSNGETGTSITVSPTETTTYDVTCTTVDGCSSTASVTVEVVSTPPPADCNDAQVYIPNTFTPNGDGTNDAYRLYSENNIAKLEYLIYNRWGEQIFMGNSIDATWDGKYEGELLPPDVYAYCVRWTCPNDESKEYLKTGNITLVR